MEELPKIEERLPLEEWQRLEEDLSQLKHSLVEAMKPELPKLRGFVDAISKWSKDIPEEIEKESYLAWHILVGSTPDYVHSPLGDLPPPYSGAEFLKKIQQEL